MSNEQVDDATAMLRTLDSLGRDFQAKRRDYWRDSGTTSRVYHTIRRFDRSGDRERDSATGAILEASVSIVVNPDQRRITDACCGLERDGMIWKPFGYISVDEGHTPGSQIRWASPPLAYDSIQPALESVQAIQQTVIKELERILETDSRR